MYFGAFLGWLKACNRNVPWDHICFHGRVSQHRFHLDYFKTFSSEMLTFTLYLNWALWQKKNHFVVWRVRFFSSISLLWNNQFCKLIVCKVYLPCFRTCTYLVFFFKSYQDTSFNSLVCSFGHRSHLWPIQDQGFWSLCVFRGLNELEQPKLKEISTKFWMFRMSHTSLSEQIKPFEASGISRVKKTIFLPKCPLKWNVCWKTPEQSLVLLIDIMNRTHTAAALSLTLPHPFSPPVFHPDHCSSVAVERKDKIKAKFSCSLWQQTKKEKSFLKFDFFIGFPCWLHKLFCPGSCWQ